MSSWRAKLGFLIPAGTPTVEIEMPEVSPRGVSVHFSRMTARGADGTLNGLDDRIASQIKHIDETAGLMACVKPNVMVLAHTATCYQLGPDGETSVCARIKEQTGIPFITVLQSAVLALQTKGVRKVALGTPYDERWTMKAKAGLESYGFEIVKFEWLKNVRSVFDEPPGRAYGLGRSVDCPEADAVFLSGVGMPTVSVLDALERDLGKPVISSASAMMWNALRVAGVEPVVPGYGSLLAGNQSGGSGRPAN